MPYTKVVATLGPASRDRAVLAAMIENGVDVVRVNCSHGTGAEHAEAVAFAHEVAAGVGRRIAVLADLQGPKVRVGTLHPAGLPLETGAMVVLRAGREHADPDGAVPVAYPHLASDVRAGDRILLDDGRIELRAGDVAGNDVCAEVVRGGLLRSRKGLNLPGVALTAQSPTLKDLEDAAAVVGAGADYVALSFVRSADDVQRLREAVTAFGDPAVVAKLERPEALDHLVDIVEASDAVMVARGDLGVEMGPELVPVLQKRIITTSNARAKPVITATEMLESMVTASRPTRAEASDVANAVFDGTSAVMLSAETAVGIDPVRVVRYAVRICETAESAPEYVDRPPPPHGPLTPARAIARAVVQAVTDLRAVAVVVHTQTGSSSRLVSSFRPGVPILALSPYEATLRRAALHHGVRGELVPAVDDSLLLVAQANEKVLATGLARAGDTVIVVAGAPGQAGGTNRMLVHTVDPALTPADPQLMRRRATDTTL